LLKKNDKGPQKRETDVKEQKRIGGSGKPFAQAEAVLGEFQVRQRKTI